MQLFAVIHLDDIAVILHAHNPRFLSSYVHYWRRAEVPKSAISAFKVIVDVTCLKLSATRTPR